MKSLYFSSIYRYLTYGNFAWCGTSLNKTKKLFSKQEKAIEITLMADIQGNLNFDETFRQIFKNIYKLNLYQIVI